MEKKGIPYLLESMPEIVKHHPGLGLVLVGYGVMENELKRIVSDLKIAPYVRFAGRKSHGDIIRYLHGCRVAVIPSIVDRFGEADGMPTTTMEALASGSRVVACDADGIPDVILHGKNGWLCRPKDPSDLTEKILTALNDPTPSPILERAKETADRFDWSNVAGRYFETIDELVRNEP